MPVLANISLGARINVKVTSCSLSTWKFSAGILATLPDCSSAVKEARKRNSAPAVRSWGRARRRSKVREGVELENLSRKDLRKLMVCGSIPARADVEIVKVLGCVE